MNTYRFKTTLKCSGCVAKLTPYLNEVLVQGEWSADMASPLKIITVTTDLPAEKVIEVIRTAGFKAEQL